MKVQHGTVYMTSIAEDTNVMGVIINRMWWKPWMWQVTPIYYKKYGADGYINESSEGPPIRNLTKLGAVGVAKLLGVTHKDFEDEERARERWS